MGKLITLALAAIVASDHLPADAGQRVGNIFSSNIAALGETLAALTTDAKVQIALLANDSGAAKSQRLNAERSAKKNVSRLVQDIAPAQTQKR